MSKQKRMLNFAHKKKLALARYYGLLCPRKIILDKKDTARRTKDKH